MKMSTSSPLGSKITNLHRMMSKNKDFVGDEEDKSCWLDLKMMKVEGAKDQVVKIQIIYVHCFRARNPILSNSEANFIDSNKNINLSNFIPD